MATIRTLSTRVDKLERRRNQNGEFRVVEEYSPESEFWAECHYVLRRNDVLIVRWPKKCSSAEQWKQCYSPNP